MATRSYGRPICNQKRPGLELVSPGHRYYIYAEPLIALYAEPGRYKVVKNRDKRPDKAIGYHPGQILGRMDRVDNDWLRLTLILGEGCQDIEPDGNGGLRNVLREHQHYMPFKEWSLYVTCLKLVLRQRAVFDEARMLAGCLPPWETPDDDK